VGLSSICQPMNGFVTVYLNGGDGTIFADNEEASIRSDLLRVVRSGMSNDVYATGNVKKVVFLGKRIFDEAPVSPIETSPQIKVFDDDDGITSVGKGLISAFAILFAFFMLLVLIRRRRKIDEVAAIDEPLASDWVKIEPAVIVFPALPRPPVRRTIYGANIPGSLAEKDELALMPSTKAAFDDGSSLSSGASSQIMAPMDPIPHLLTLTNTDDIEPGSAFVPNTCHAEIPMMTVPEAPRANDHGENMLDKFDGDIIKCLNIIAEDSGDDTVIQGSVVGSDYDTLDEVRRHLT
jgi:hypothetical protein